jgi:glyoxylase-like metal-dependent hydrolase (beta-lactamase superfamily II)
MSEALTSDGRVRIVPTPGHTMGHQSVVLDLGDHYVLIAGDASYNEAAMIRGEVDGVAQSAKFHHDSTRRMRQLCTRRPTITLFAHDPDSNARLLAGAVIRNPASGAVLPPPSPAMKVRLLIQ